MGRSVSPLSATVLHGNSSGGARWASRRLARACGAVASVPAGGGREEGPAPGLGESDPAGMGRGREPTVLHTRHGHGRTIGNRGSADLLAKVTLYIEDPRAGRGWQVF